METCRNKHDGALVLRGDRYVCLEPNCGFSIKQETVESFRKQTEPAVSVQDSKTAAANA